MIVSSGATVETITTRRTRRVRLVDCTAVRFSEHLQQKEENGSFEYPSNGRRISQITSNQFDRLRQLTNFSGWRLMARDPTPLDARRPARRRRTLPVAPATRIISASFSPPRLSRDQRNLAPYMARFDQFVGPRRLAK